MANLVAIYSSNVTKILECIKTEVLGEYYGNNLKASGRFGADLKIIFGNRLIMPLYGIFLEDNVGRFPGGRPPAQAIESWMKAKGIVARNDKTGKFISYKKASFAIAKKIGLFGTDIHQGTRSGISYDDIINQCLDENLDEMADELVNGIADD